MITSLRPTLLRLHWLPVRQRVQFKIAVLVYQFLNGLAPSYLADDCQLVSDVRPRRLRSSDWPALSNVHGPSTATGVLPTLADECGILCQPN